MTMTLPPPVIVETLYCPRCKSDILRTGYRVVMFNVSPGQADKGLPVLTVLKHWNCGGMVYELQRRRRKKE